MKKYLVHAAVTFEKEIAFQISVTSFPTSLERTAKSAVIEMLGAAPGFRLVGPACELPL